jgi:hypothetical protein
MELEGEGGEGRKREEDGGEGREGRGRRGGVWQGKDPTSHHIQLLNVNSYTYKAGTLPTKGH